MIWADLVMPMMKPSTLPRAIGQPASRRSYRLGSSSRSFGAITSPITLWLGRQDLAQAEQADATGTMPMRRRARRDRSENGRSCCHAIMPSSSPMQAISSVRSGSATCRRGRSGHHQQCGVFRRAESERDGGERRRDQGENDAGLPAKEPTAACRARHGAAPWPWHCRRCKSSPRRLRRGSASGSRWWNRRASRNSAGQHGHHLCGVEPEGDRQRIEMPAKGPMPGNTPTSVPGSR